MGYWKELDLRQQEQGWSYRNEEWVCSNCVDDPALEKLLKDNAQEDQVCGYCERAGAAPLDVLVEAFVAGVKLEYGQADDEGLFWDGREGGYQGANTLNTWDLFDEFYYVFRGEGLIDAVRGSMEDTTWVAKDFAQRHINEVLSDSWARFCNVIKYQTRYVFWLQSATKQDDEDRDTGEVPPIEVLQRIGVLIEQLDLVQPLPAGTRLWRARAHKSGQQFDLNANSLGTIPHSIAIQANRMSPAGIPLFYGAQDPDTAVREANGRSRTSNLVTIAEFETSRDCQIVDFARLRPVPSLFDPELGRLRRHLLFLHSFVNDLRKRAVPDHEQIDYVPTQVVTEYLLRVYGGGGVISGLMYTSEEADKWSIALDVDNENCVETTAGWRDAKNLRLGLIKKSVVTQELP